jgi:hypothetical protein
MIVRRSPRINKTKDVFQVPGIAGAVALTIDGKENFTPDSFMVDSFGSFEDFFDMDMSQPVNEPSDALMLPPSTPHRRSERLHSKTPQRAFGDSVSPNAQRTPRKTPKAKQAENDVIRSLFGSVANKLDNMTPISRSLHEAINAGNWNEETLTPNKLRKQPMRNSPNKNVTFDFPDLPSLQGSSPSTRNDDPQFSVNFSELPTDILQTDVTAFSTDAPMPSSPPAGFDTLDFGIHHDSGLDDWTQLQEDHGVKPTYPDPADLGANVPLTPRRSGRHRD